MKFIKLFHTQPSELHIGGVVQIWANGDTEMQLAHEEQAEGKVVSQQWDSDTLTLTLMMEGATEQTITWESNGDDEDD